ncbi:HEAT repeat domain-containing protein [Paenibacillus sp. 1001270B_150601_E10]|uniref:HEAT repeat domain-containing protein n=1 Tax=Paenibacillus sp. 1001270B_150601_E10 TaxID=2787079 RepID=UPI00189CDC07|nr:HEAT repeat domain-containing protein [Paenibacillus sp. 1001270B_150601_E10]
MEKRCEELQWTKDKMEQIKELSSSTIRLLQSDEINNMEELFRQMYPQHLPISWLWTDDNSNYAGVYMDGPMKGMICYLNHEEPDYSPVFQSIDRFLAAILQAGPDAYMEELQTDYPGTLAGELEWGVVQQLTETVGQLDDEEARVQYLFALMSLTPANKLDTLLPYLDDEDMYVQERVCDIIGYYGYVPAKDKLKWIAEHGSLNGRSAAKRALSHLR